MKKNQLLLAEKLASRPYQIHLQEFHTPDGEPYFFGRVPELPGCISDGETEQEAKANVRLAMIDFIYFLLEDGLPVPEPRDISNFTAINMSDVADNRVGKRTTEYKRLSLGSSYSVIGAFASDLERRIYVA